VTLIQQTCIPVLSFNVFKMLSVFFGHVQKLLEIRLMDKLDQLRDAKSCLKIVENHNYVKQFITFHEIFISAL